MFFGSIPAVITPFKDQEIDLTSFNKIIEHLIVNGSNGIVPCGTTGESPTLSHEEHKKIIEEAIRIVDKRIPVIAGTGSNNTIEAIEFTKHAQHAGADAALVVTPYYNKPTQSGLYEHYKLISENTSLPIIIYNIPGRSIVDMSIETMVELSKIKNIIGVKDATNDLFRPLLTRSFMDSDFCFLSGEDGTALAYLAQGGHGCISVTANVAPRLTSKLHYYWQVKNYKQFDLVNMKLAPLSQILFSEPSPTPSKYALSLMGRCKADVREPLTDLSPETKKQVRKVLKDLNFI